MTVPGEFWPVTLTASQASHIDLVAHEEIIGQARWGDPRNVTDECKAVERAIRSERRNENGQMEVALTAGQWDVMIAALDRAALSAMYRGEPDMADSSIQARDAVLAQAADHLPAHTGQRATARHRLAVEDAPGYLLLQPVRRGRYLWTGNARVPADLGTAPLTTIDHNRLVLAHAGAREVDVEIQVLPEAPDPDPASWEAITEITKQWSPFPYPELVLALPGQEGTVLWNLTTEVWPHVTYRVRLSVNASDRAAEEHLLQMWPDHTAPPTVHKQR
ncbi:hypothetical protein [Actinomadura vinacea]